MKHKELYICLTILLISLGIVFYYLFFIDQPRYRTAFEVNLKGEIKDNIDKMYKGYTKEFVLCLGGELKNNTIYITEMQEAEIRFANESKAIYVECPYYIGLKQTMGTLHNHINAPCVLSKEDFLTYYDDLNIGGKIISVVCNEGIVFYLLSVFPITN